MRSYLTQARQETASRLVAIVYADGAPSKWWLAFTVSTDCLRRFKVSRKQDLTRRVHPLRAPQKRKFMGKAL